MKSEIREIVLHNLIDEIRFIDANDFTEEHAGALDPIKDRQPKMIMPEAKTIIFASIYIGKFVTPAIQGYGKSVD